VSRGQIVHVIGFAASGGSAFEVFSVPRCCSYLIRQMMICFSPGAGLGSRGRASGCRTLGVFRP
jgi:hypothetical protein